MNIDIREAEKQARKELEQEAFRKAVEVAKDRLRQGRWWHRYLPWRINIIVTRR